MLRPQARTIPCGWWNQIVTVGRTRKIRRRAQRVSGSDQGSGPEYWRVPRRPIDFHIAPKLRFRSTPRSFWRVPRRTPIGFSDGTIQSCSPDGVVLRSACATGIPAGSLPWMQPTTSTTGP